jgi:hypothetical protein
MIYFENASRGAEGFNTHVMSWTFCVSFSNFLGRDLYFDFEIPSSTPPAFAFTDDYKSKFGILLESQRSLVTDLVQIPNRRVFEIDRTLENKASFQMSYSHFASTAAMREKFGNTLMWDYFGMGRRPIIREELNDFDLIEWTHTKLVHPSCFYFLPREEKNELLESIQLRYLDSIETLAKQIVARIGQFNAVHIRRGDFGTTYWADEYRIEIERFRKYARRVFQDDSIPVVIATDGLDSKEVLESIFEGCRTVYIDELIFDEYIEDFRALEFTDFNVLTILNQLICASADRFIGTYRSTFTSIIHRLRQERFRKKDFNFLPDERVARLLDENFDIVPDRNGFFQWNKYSAFAENHNILGWMREWDIDQSSIDI